MNDIAAIYADKPAAYFGGARQDIVQLLPTGPDDAVLELGCGSGGTGLAALAAGKAGYYVGIELDSTAAQLARGVLTDVLIGDVTQMDLSGYEGRFEALIVSEVLEHLTDPWGVLRKLVDCLKPGAVVYASSPNVAHWRVVADLIQGQFVYTQDGVMDRTHLRWFTPASFRELFETAGVSVQSVGPLVTPGWKARLIAKLSGGRLTHLFTSQIMLTGYRT
jgi:2-polyprenyl-3-methyl-5-hydroxy-6-metoxy-1,4-benzoquinol methylase